MLQAYIFWAHACYLLLRDLSKRAEKGKIYSTYLTTLKPGIILLGCQPRALWARHSPIIFKTKTQFPTQPQDKASPSNSSSAGLLFFFLYPLSTILDTGLLNVMEGGVCVPDYITLQLLQWGQCQLPWQFYCLYYEPEPNWTQTNLHRQIQQQLLMVTVPRAGSRSLVERVCVWSSLALTFTVSIWIRVLTMTSLIDIV